MTPFLAQPLTESSKYFQFDVIDQCSTYIFQHCVLPFMLSCTCLTAWLNGNLLLEQTKAS